MATQARLPATLPSPAQAKANLRMARSALKEKRNVVDGLKARHEAARDEAADAEAEVDGAETDLVECEEGSSAEVSADKRHHKACARLDRAEADAERVGSALKLAKSELKNARAQMRTARADIEAIREGRRSNAN